MGDQEQPKMSDSEMYEEVQRENQEPHSGQEFESSGESDGSDEEVARLRDALLRTRAEMDNMEKRSRRELDKARKFQLEGLMRELLPVIDALEQGLDGADDSESAHEGLVLTRKLLLKALEQYGLEILDPAGEPFDPRWHEAMSMQPSEETDPDTVLTVLQKGYRLHDRLLRAARVIVAKAP
jgi:molecular chaperone GrpE